jgi:GH15 family glucan-1,4-alpha-glucosidase
MNPDILPPSLDLGVIGNASAAALIDRQGAVVWMCAPRMDGDPVFCRLLDGAAPDGGDWSITVDALAACQQRYVRNTAVLETVQTDEHGNRLRIIDFAPRFKARGRIFRPLTLIRIVEPLEGSPRVRIRLRPRHGYGAQRPETTRGTNHLRFILGADERLEEAPMTVARDFLANTIVYWQEWVRYLSVPVDFQDVVIRSAITLKLCSHEETGGIVAALTTSIPEYGESGRTWDYRFSWLRDSYFTVKALNLLGATKTMEDYLRYVSNVAAGSPDGYLQPLFGLGFERRIEETTVASLAGYRGHGPVRAGNAAYTQVQNDGYGSVVLSVIQYFFDERLPAAGDEGLFRRLEPLGVQAVRRWNQPDAGIWEFRTRNGVHTHSAMMCWAACDRLARIAARLGLGDRADHWRGEAELIRAAVLEQAWDEKLQSFTSTFGGADLDASLLLMPEIGIIAARDPRFLSTLAACEKKLRFGNHIYRYRAPDDFGEPETAFTGCTFWLIDALARVGRHDDALAVFNDVLDHRNHLGLLSEGLHVDSGELWGNFPQTYSMVGLVNAAMRLSRRWEDVL